MIRSFLLGVGFAWAIEYPIEPSGGFGVTVYMVAADILHKLAYAVGVI